MHAQPFDQLGQLGGEQLADFGRRRLARIEIDELRRERLQQFGYVRHAVARDRSLIEFGFGLDVGIEGGSRSKYTSNMQANDTYTTTETRCSTVTDTSENVVGYDVKYQVDGKVGQVRMDRDPGSRIPLNEQGQLVLAEPAQVIQ